MCVYIHVYIYTTNIPTHVHTDPHVPEPPEMLENALLHLLNHFAIYVVYFWTLFCSLIYISVTVPTTLS